MYLSLIYSSKIAMPTISPLYICMEKIGLLNVCHMDMEITMNSQKPPNFISFKLQMEPHNRRSLKLQRFIQTLGLSWFMKPQKMTIFHHCKTLKNLPILDALIKLQMEPHNRRSLKLQRFIQTHGLSWFMNPQKMTIFHVFPEEVMAGVRVE